MGRVGPSGEPLNYLFFTEFFPRVVQPSEAPIPSSTLAYLSCVPLISSPAHSADEMAEAQSL